MAHITEFTIVGLIGKTGSFHQKLNRDVNVFFGMNGSGKTSLLKILHSAMKTDATPLKKVRFDRAEVHIYSITYGGVFVYEIVAPKPSVPISESDDSEDTVSLDSESTEFAWRLIDKPKGADKKPLTAWCDKYLPISRLLETPDRARVPSEYPDGQTTAERLDKRFAAGLQSVWSAYYSDLQTAARGAQEKGLQNILREVLDETEKDSEISKAPDAAYERVLRFLSRQKETSGKVLMSTKATFLKRYKSDPRLRSVVNDIEQVEREIEAATKPDLPPTFRLPTVT